MSVSKQKEEGVKITKKMLVRIRLPFEILRKNTAQINSKNKKSKNPSKKRFWIPLCQLIARKPKIANKTSEPKLCVFIKRNKKNNAHKGSVNRSISVSK